MLWVFFPVGLYVPRYTVFLSSLFVLDCGTGKVRLSFGVPLANLPTTGCRLYLGIIENEIDNMCYFRKTDMASERN